MNRDHPGDGLQASRCVITHSTAQCHTATGILATDVVAYLCSSMSNTGDKASILDTTVTGNDFGIRSGAKSTPAVSI